MAYTGKLIHVHWAPDPVRRKIEAGITMLDDDALALLTRLELLVKRNAAGLKGDGYVYDDGGHKADRKWVLQRLARMKPELLDTVERNLTTLKNVGEVDFDRRGRPYLKHWRTDRSQSKTSESENKTRRRDEVLISEAKKHLDWYLRSGEPRTVEAFCKWMGFRLSKCPSRTMPRIVELLEANDVILIEDGVVSVSNGALPSPPSAARPLPSIEPKGHKIKQQVESETFPIDRESIEKEEDFYEIPIASIGGTPDSGIPEPGTAPAKGGRGRAAEGPLNSDAPVGRFDTFAPDSSGRGTGKHTGSYRKPRYFRPGGFDRSLTGRTYAGWVEGTSPHPHRTKSEVQEFRSGHVHDCDLIDGMLYLAADGAPPGCNQFPGGQESLFKSMLRRINNAAGGAGAADQLVRRVLLDFSEDLMHQKRPFSRDAKVLMSKLKKLEKELLSVSKR